MIAYPDIDPVIFSLGPLQVRWYGLMYVLGFTASVLLVRYQINRYRIARLADYFDNLNLVLMVSLIIGGRLGYVLFYSPGYFLRHPLEIFATWQGGMSFHGALLGLVLAGFFYCRRHGLGFLRTADLYVVTVPIGLGLGRLGNFINGELYGRVSDLPWAMIFPQGGPRPRHPSQLYEFFLAGFLLFVILWTLKSVQHRRNWPAGTMLGAFLVLYGIFRCLAELFREPDAQLGFIWFHLTMGQLLSSLMIGAGLLILLCCRERRT
ncbi:MAG: prolipoprotein diacylglyceryl transferase [Desulfobacterales bacterium]|nr:prolipoprotein diacylglyceryl transferase [Desulfobacterales bacterium]